MAPSSKTVTTSFLLGNLHCPSCVALIKRLLHDEYRQKMLWVSPNVVTSVVTVEHEDASPDFIRSMGRTLNDVGFDICAVDSSAVQAADLNAIAQDEENPPAASGYRTFDLWSRLWRNKSSPASDPTSLAAAHLQNCEACKSATGHEQSRMSEDRIRLVRTLSLASSTQEGSPTTATTMTMPLEGVLVPGEDAINDGAPPLMRATLSIGGMTCAVCVNTISGEVRKNPWVSNIVVNLVSNSATVDFTDPNRARDIVDAIEDLGYDAVLNSVVDVKKQRRAAAEREMEIQVDGIFCPRCPDRICQSLRNLGPGRVEVLQEPTLELPRLRVRYLPDVPLLTIRHILGAIEATDPSLSASVYHPPTLEERSRAIRARHQRQLFRRQMLTAVIAVPTFVLGIVYMSLVPESDPVRRFLMEPWTSGLSLNEVMLCLLATPVYFFAADVFHVRAVKELRTLWRGNSRTPLLQRFYKFGSMNMLISLGTTIAYFSSVAEMVAAAVRHETHVPESRFYFDSVVFLTLFLLAGRLIEGYSKSKTGDAVEALAKLRPSTALLIETDKLGSAQTRVVKVDLLEHGDMIRVPNGSSPPADGVIVTGETSLDESSLTGESRPIKKRPGDEVYAGTVNKGDAVTVRVTGTCGRSMLDQIVEVVREGQTKRAPVEQVADLLTSYFVPVVTLVAVVTWITWLVLAMTGRVSDEQLNRSGGSAAFAFQFAIAVFVVACPCGLALAAPTAIFVGGGIAAQNGILAKGGGEAFEKASKIDCVVFDKTGTLTVGGEPRVTDSVLFPSGSIDGVDERTLLSGLKATEENSGHPMARAAVRFCGPRVESAPLAKVEELPGKGMRAAYSDAAGTELAVGNEHLMRDLPAALPAHVVDVLAVWKGEAKSVALVAARTSEGGGKWKLAGALAVSDPVRPEAVAVVRALRRRGTDVWMLSGDNETTAQAVGRQVGIAAANVLAEVLPSEKAAKVAMLQATLHGGDGEDVGGDDDDDDDDNRHSTGRRGMVAMVGDGINDAPALTRADVGIAIGSGSDVAISSADFVLATSKLSAVVTLLDLSSAVLRRIKVNFCWALVYNVLAVPVAAGCLWPVRTSSGGHVRLDPVWAALAMALSSISVVLSSLSLRSRVP
ncbi:hypothetical protein L249_2675 [Ophiocordyceps polyrhachis-furcata BCC 54312]|uniref:HMA domain-containing protein n=1 Tax=Ophiocordyceps polyrhachis-furcata BCC 54312 TaxID=1330021 RepID=A0A367LSJ5_9HYPO|nr:hypothetical protein L249_2675 [Ophiocordyceps polyrhachis-furcata BCC 54312]